jgi:hypothetical protein
MVRVVGAEAGLVRVVCPYPKAGKRAKVAKTKNIARALISRRSQPIMAPRRQSWPSSDLNDEVLASSELQASPSHLSGPHRLYARLQGAVSRPAVLSAITRTPLALAIPQRLSRVRSHYPGHWLRRAGRSALVSCEDLEAAGEFLLMSHGSCGSIIHWVADPLRNPIPTPWSPLIPGVASWNGL